VTEPPLVNSSPNPATRRLLEAGLHDEPPPELRPTVAAALGVSVPSTASSASALARVELSSGPARPVLPRPRETASRASPRPARLLDGAGKWFLAGALFGVVACAVILLVRSAPERSEPTATPAVTKPSSSVTKTTLPRPTASSTPAPGRSFDIDLDAARELAVRQALGEAPREPPTAASSAPGSPRAKP
jgi:hypothetical protein